MGKCTLFCRTTSPVEAHNDETKARDSGVRPSYSTLSATKVIVTKENYKSSAKLHNSAKVLNQKPSWSATVTAPHVTSFAEGILKEQWLQRDFHSIVQVNKNMFLLCNSDDTKCNSYIPRFCRVRTVSIEHGRVRCSYRHFEQCHIACRHIMAITKKITLDFADVR